MWEVEETELLPPLSAATYRRLWLDSEDRLGLIAETLTEVLGWQPTCEQPLPDPLELAQVAAARLTAREMQPRHRSHRRPQRKGLHSVHLSVN